MHPQYLVAHAKLALAVDPRVAATDLVVDVRRGVLHVRGEVDSERIRQAIDEILGELAGVERFENHTTLRVLAGPVHEHLAAENP